MAFFTLKEIQELRDYCIAVKATGPAEAFKASNQDWQQVCNGTGPDAWPGWLRNTATWLRTHKRAATAMHDWRFELSDGTGNGFYDANQEYFENSRKEVNYHFPLWKVWRLAHRVREIRQCYTDKILLDDFGWEAWVEAHKRRLAKQQQEGTTQP